MLRLRSLKRRTDIVCNKCGASCFKSFDDDMGEDYGLIEAIVSAGYLSTDLEDGHHYRFSLCEKCLKELFDSFKIAVRTTSYFPE